MKVPFFSNRAVLGISTLFCALGPVGNGDRPAGDHHGMDPATHRALVALSAPLGAWEPTSGAPLEAMPVLRSKNGRLNANLNPAPRAIDLSGSQVGAIPYDENFTGPTLKVKPGDTLRVRLENDSGQMTNIHYHGLHVSPKKKGDNVFRMMKNGSTYTSVIKIPKDHETGLFWYHAHMHGNTDPQIYGGMRGLLVVGDIVRKHLPDRFQNIRERLFSINDAYEKAGTIQNAAPSPGDATLLMNDQLRPVWTMKPGETQLLRFANTGSDRFYRLWMRDHPFTVIAEDGSPVWKVRRQKTLVMPPGKRFEVLVTAPRQGTFRLRTTRYAQDETKFGLNPAATLGTMIVEGERRNRLAPLKRLKGPLPKSLASAKPVRTRKFVFGLRAKGNNFARINGKFFRVREQSVRPKLGTVERWILRNPRKPNKGNDSQHPFHIHVNDFQVVRVNGRKYRARGQQDIVVIPVGGEVVIKQRFEDFTGKFVFHCHILAHEDGGMMQSVKVVK
ncbi:MAG: multicopper oxidase family protein [Solirubrobacterales bacterium]